VLLNGLSSAVSLELIGNTKTVRLHLLPSLLLLLYHISHPQFLLLALHIANDYHARYFYLYQRASHQ
jgi:hypothetical protein